MAKLEELGQGVKYLPHFVKNWDTICRRWVDLRPYYDVRKGRRGKHTNTFRANLLGVNRWRDERRRPYEP